MRPAPDAEPLGYVIIWVVADECHILNIAVHPEHRGKGTGRRMLEYVEAFCAERGVAVIHLEVRPSNKAAIGLYRKMGYVFCGVRPRYYTDTGEDALLMQKTLGKAA